MEDHGGFGKEATSQPFSEHIRLNPHIPDHVTFRGGYGGIEEE